MKRHLLVILFAFAGFIGHIHAQNIWQKLTLPENSSFSIQASPNGKLFLSMKNNLYVSSDEGSSWNIVGAPANFQIDSLGVFISIKEHIEKYSFDEGKTWQVDSNVPSYLQFVVPTKDSIFIFTFEHGPDGYASGDYGKHWLYTGVYFDQLPWEAAYLSPLGKLFGIQSDCECFININENREKVILKNSFICFADNNPPEFVCFDYGGFGYFIQLCSFFRSSDSGITWSLIDSAKNKSSRFFPPYIPLLNNSLLAVNDSVTVISFDHADTWQKIGSGIPQFLKSGGFINRRNFAFVVADSSLYRLSLFASVNSPASNSEDIVVNYNQESDRIELQSTSPLGSTTASLYTIDGRLLKRTKLDISSPGIFSFDVSDVHTRFAILVLQTGRGVITKKILF